MSQPRLYIATRDPRDGGGVQSMAGFVYRVAEDAGYDPCLVCNMLDRESQIRLSGPLRAARFDAAANVEHMTVDGLEVKGVPLIFPEVEFTQYVFNGNGWRKATKDGDLFFAVGGTNQCNVPFLRQGKTFGSWTATLLWEDRIDRLGSAPLVERVRDHLSRPILERIERKAFEAADPPLVLSEYTADRLAAKYGIVDVEVVPYPIDTETFVPTPSEEDPDPESPVILFVGRFNDPRKNITMLIEAFARLRETVPDAELWLVGDEPDDSVREAAVDCGVADAITFHERLPNEELPQYYRAADVFVIPSNQEGLAIVGLEAMACGTPVVATRCGGPEQYVRSGETGYLVERDDAAALADRVESLLADPGHRNQLGEASRDLIEQEYAESKIRRRFRSILATLRSPDTSENDPE